MTHSYGYKRKTRHKFRKGFKQHGAIHISKSLTSYKIGDIVDIVVDGAIHKGMPYKYYHGRTGRVFNVNPRAIGVIVNKQVRQRIIPKRIHVRVAPQALHLQSGFPQPRPGERQEEDRGQQEGREDFNKESGCPARWSYQHREAQHRVAQPQAILRNCLILFNSSAISTINSKENHRLRCYISPRIDRMCF